MRLLIIEDNPDIVANLYGFLEPKGYVLDSAGNGYGGLALAAQHEYDAVVLDVMLPGLNGLELCQKVAGFDSGADDYLVKPFSLVELEVRLRALVRRARGSHGGSAVLTVGDLSFDTETFEARRAGRPLALTKTGYTILKLLMKEAPKVVLRDAVAHEVWGDNPPDSDALRVHIHALRQALDKPYPFAMLRTISGIGYKLVTSDEQT